MADFRFRKKKHFSEWRDRKGGFGPKGGLGNSARTQGGKPSPGSGETGSEPEGKAENVYDIARDGKWTGSAPGPKDARNRRDAAGGPRTGKHAGGGGGRKRVPKDTGGTHEYVTREDRTRQAREARRNRRNEGARPARFERPFATKTPREIVEEQLSLIEDVDPLEPMDPEEAALLEAGYVLDGGDDDSEESDAGDETPGDVLVKAVPRGEAFPFPPLKKLLRGLGLSTIHARGQHFLRRADAGDRIVDACGLTNDDVVVEIGAGLGNISVPIARRAGKVHAVEPDQRFAPWHEQLHIFFPNLEFHHADFMKCDVRAWIPEGVRPVAIGNLPYNMTSPILFSLLEGGIAWRRIVVMVQREVAERMIAPPGDKTYGALSLKVQYYTKPRIILAVPPGEFIPPPKVHSRVVAMEPREDPLGGDVERRKRVFRLIEIAFQHRRKTLGNALCAGGGWWAPERELLAQAIHNANIHPEARPETLAFERWADLEASLRLLKPKKS